MSMSELYPLCLLIWDCFPAVVSVLLKSVCLYFFSTCKKSYSHFTYFLNFILFDWCLLPYFKILPKEIEVDKEPPQFETHVNLNLHYCET